MSAEVKIRTELKYCACCKGRTLHQVVSEKTDGKDLKCTVFGSARLGEIQGFDAALM